MTPISLKDISNQLTEDVIANVFKLHTKGDDCLQDVKVSRGAPAGEGLIGAVYKIEARGKRENISIFVKSFVKDVMLRKTLNCTVYFSREAQFYTEVLPLLVEVQKSLGASESIQNYVPICYGSYCDGTDDYLLMEDLSENFETLSNFPTEYENEVTLKTLAHLHAVSIALRVTKPDVFYKTAKRLNEVYYRESNKSCYNRFLKAALDINKDVIIEYDRPDSIYYKKFMDLVSEDLYGTMINLVSTWGDHPTFTHGDAWCKNFLFSKNKAVAIDFQFYRCSSAAIDISYFIIMSDFQSKDEYLHYIDTYYMFLKHYLEDMGLDANKVYSRGTLNDELKKFGKFSILAAMTSIPLVISDRYDVLESVGEKYINVERIPLEELWPLSSYKKDEEKLRLISALHVAVDLGYI